MGEFSPYVDNGGTTLAIAGPDFVVIAGDTRLSTGYSILSRDVSKLFKYSDSIVMASSGMQADIAELRKQLLFTIEEYRVDNERDIELDAFYRLLATVLYGKRFFPYYSFNILAGISKEGKGVVYSYDAIGSADARTYGAAGSGQELVISILDAALKRKPDPLSIDEAIELGKSALKQATEREIHTGDSGEMYIIRAGRPAEYITFKLRKD
ncbi:putative multi-domain containing protein [Aduncisulcus paluster]|uniref:Proteasome subunit beta n=1 Tax=Aduncisulcus paluster TaxID=2918883 RepID=A0ABQ5K492_9EUKA|nr:putative multi-domain containing protein [Aduncisulcus paluster]